MTGATTVDCHAHVFRPATVSARAVDALAPSDRDAPVEDLLTTMEGGRVGRAVLVPLGPQDDYVAECVRQHPGTFAAVAVADLAVQGRIPSIDPLDALRKRTEHFPFHALRTGWLGDPAAGVDESPMLPALRYLTDRGIALWSYLPRSQTPLLRQLIRKLPDLTVVLNHLGFCPHDMQVDQYGRPRFATAFGPGDVDALLEMARFPHVYLMFSGQYALSKLAPPYTDLDETVRALADAYGAARMPWASDYPWTRDVPGYRTMLSLPEETFPDASPTELADIHGGAALRLFPALALDQET